MYYPYCHSPSALTGYLKQKLCHQQAKRLGHSLSAQVEQNVPLECNIYCDTNTIICIQQKAIGAHCTADKECASFNYLPNQTCGVDPSNPCARNKSEHPSHIVLLIMDKQCQEAREHATFLKKRPTRYVLLEIYLLPSHASCCVPFYRSSYAVYPCSYYLATKGEHTNIRVAVQKGTCTHQFKHQCALVPQCGMNVAAGF